ncbi:MAG: sterol desaturase family protein [Pseudomonadota bacterium]
MPSTTIFIASEPAIRLTGFALAFAVLVGLEFLSPARGVPHRFTRWRSNLGLIVAGTILLRLTFPVAAFGTAIWAEAHHVGLFHLVNLPYALAFLLSLIALDLLIYGQHVVSHHVPLLWRLHKVHHSDTDLDVTTALRFHPFEIALSMMIKMAAVAGLGAPPLAVLTFEILLNATAMFSHANIALGPKADQLLRRVIVTPDMHRVHHSDVVTLQNRNFGFNLSLWDRIFATYHSVDKAGLATMRIGLAGLDDSKPGRFFWSLILPFLNNDTKSVADGDKL